MPGFKERLTAGDRIRRAIQRRPVLCDDFVVYGHMRAVLRDEHGRVKEVREESNLIVTTGRDAIIERLDSTPATAQPSHMGLGTSSTAPAAGNTTLTGEPTRVALTSSVASGGVLTMVANWAAGAATGTWSEAGVFNALTTGTMYSRATFTAIPKGASDTLQITWTYTLTPT